MQPQRAIAILVAALSLFWVTSCTPDPVSPGATTTSSTSTSSTTTTSVVLPTGPIDFAFFSGTNNADAGQYSAVLDAGSFSHVTFTLSCSNDFSFIRVLVSVDGETWLQQAEYQGANCRQGISGSLSTAGRFYRAYTQAVIPGTTDVQMIGRFSSC